MTRLAATAITLMMTAAIGTAAASPYDYGYRYEDGPFGRGDYDYARVVNVDPIVEVVSLPVSSQRCYGSRDGYAYNEGYDRYQYGYNNGYNGYYDNGYGSRYANSSVNGGKLLGALIGGALGNTVGKGDGRKAATIGGAVLGYAVAGQIQRDNRYDRGYGYNNGYSGGYGDSGYYHGTRCEIVTDYRRDRRVVGYDVTYDYRGRIQHVRSAVDPGNRIRVRVDVRPEI